MRQTRRSKVPRRLRVLRIQRLPSAADPIEALLVFGRSGM